jgi:hypothetical protein
MSRCAGTLRDGAPCKTNAAPRETLCTYHKAIEAGSVYRQFWGMGLLKIHPDGAEVLEVVMPAKKVSLFDRYLNEAGIRSEAIVRS